ncbi:Sucrose-6-phosphate hydrolase [Piscirickettsia salmonis]|uniref:glycoside hydrolase family 32 protein n=1 Tax=Piscirickettsia salmonis TaxID=1238 RepID=UPI0012BAA2D8|nr:glycoside hydrolase family 32 protein [Piscirickettsia salmonis]QGP55334.1 Sucrose-6-phosphate hydrolase [Piscirickettsia salmonis]QGP58806.1 Sucrose-6-phosphate hydrolase [Piscirickettsia salmonis]QGP64900.1 Sucrose-6-phosphate hydrolase [Piscirickettsia salmonis]
MKIQLNKNHLHLTTGDLDCIISFDISVLSEGAAKLYKNDTLIEYEPLTLSHGFAHIEWSLEKNSQYFLISESDHTVLKNGWFYSKHTLLESGGDCFSYQNKNWSIYHSLDNSQSYCDEKRLQYHFSPLTGWINDPNGLVYHKGYYHLFFQYNPYQPHWGNMHWGHAVSKDLVSWQHLPIALYPSNNLNNRFIGGAFSGSALSKDEELLITYTDHFEDSQNSKDIFIEKQKIIKSDGLTFSKPKTIINRPPNNYSKDFRDPKIWFCDLTQKFYLIIGSKANNLPSIALYSSIDANDWTYEGILFQEEKLKGRSIECPDLFMVDGVYVLVFSLFDTINNKNINHRSYYYLGNFKKNKFIPTTKIYEIDFCNHFYALQTFEDKNMNRIGIAWMNNWSDNIFSTQNHYAGAMSLPRKLSIKNNKLSMLPISQLKNIRTSQEVIFDFNQSFCQIETNKKSFEIECLFSFGIEWSMDFKSGKNIVLTILWTGSKIILKTKQKTCISPYICKPNKRQQIDASFFLDTTSIEAFIDNGTVCGSLRLELSKNNNITICTTTKPSESFTGKLWELNSIWSNERDV